MFESVATDHNQHHGRGLTTDQGRKFADHRRDKRFVGAAQFHTSSRHLHFVGYATAASHSRHIALTNLLPGSLMDAARLNGTKVKLRVFSHVPRALTRRILGTVGRPRPGHMSAKL